MMWRLRDRLQFSYPAGAKAMRLRKAFAFLGFVFFCILLSSSIITEQPLQAQNQTQIAASSGISVSVKMIDPVDSQTDPAGKQYRASVAKAVNAGNGVQIPQGTPATVVLAQGPNGWSTQLTSFTVGGQAIAVTSSSASVTSGAQSAASTAANAVGSVFGGFGRRAPPAAVTAVATGQRVILPPGVTLTFIVATPGNSGTAESAAASPAPVAQPPAASAAPAVSPVSIPASSPAAASGASTGGPVNAMEICFGSVSSPVMYLTAAFEVPVNIQGAAPPVIEPAFSAYLKATYQYAYGITCQPIWTIADAQTVQKKLTDIRDSAKPKVVDTGWRYGQPAVGPGQSGFDPLAQGPGGLDLSQHRLTTYFCVFVAPGGTTMVRPPGQLDETAYVSPIFQADWGDSAVVSRAWVVYIRDHYVHDIDLNTPPSGCNGESPSSAAGQHQGAGVGKYIGHKVPADFTYTPAQAAEAKPAVAAQAANTAAQQAATAAATFFISCSTGGGAGIDTYYTGVFEIGAKPGRSPHPPNAPGAYIGGTWMVPAVLAQTVLDHFYAYLTQKGFKFSPGSSSGCDIQPTEAATKAAQHKRAYEGGGCSTCGKVVETGWKDTQ